MPAADDKLITPEWRVEAAIWQWLRRSVVGSLGNTQQVVCA